MYTYTYTHTDVGTALSKLRSSSCRIVDGEHRDLLVGSLATQRDECRGLVV